MVIGMCGGFVDRLQRSPIGVLDAINLFRRQPPMWSLGRPTSGLMSVDTGTPPAGLLAHGVGPAGDCSYPFVQCPARAPRKH